MSKPKKQEGEISKRIQPYEYRVNMLCLAIEKAK
jgi:hypothetical protein